MKQSFIYFSLLLLGTACGSEQPKEQPVTEPVVETTTKEAPVKMTSTDMNVYQNMEIVEYCALIPKDYEESEDSNEKAGHLFLHNKKKNNVVEIKGLLRANTDVPIEQYMNSSLEDAELEGKVILKKELSKEMSCFYTKGYWNNSINESRFIEVCWLRRDDVVKYSTVFDIADTTLWNNRLKEILSAGSFCK